MARCRDQRGGVSGGLRNGVMNRRERTLLAQIEQDVLDDTRPLAGALRKCVVLGGHAGFRSAARLGPT